MTVSRKPVRIKLESTSEILAQPPPARVWRGRSEDGVPVLAFVTLLAGGSGAHTDARLQLALETRIRSSAVITIPRAAPGR